MTKLLVLHAILTLIFTGIIWFVQIVHYPLLKYVDNIENYEKQHKKIVMIPAIIIMTLETITGVLLLLYKPNNVSYLSVYIGLILIAIIQYQTWFNQVPCHNKLSTGFSLESRDSLIKTNWIRTISYTLRSLLIGYMLISSS
jgi:uncharacterized membrane protein